MTVQDNKKDKNKGNAVPAYTILSIDLDKQVTNNLNSGDSKRIFGKIVADMEDKEIDRRINMVVKGLKEYKDLAKQIDNTKADLQAERDENGVEVVPARFSTKVWQERTKLVEKINTLAEALTSAEKKNDFTALDKLYAKGSKE